MPVIEIQRVPGLPKDRAIVTAGTVFSEWLEQESFHRDIRIRVNGNELGPDDELAFPLQENDRVIIFDQPKDGGLIGTILNPLEHFNPIKFTQKVLAGLMPKPNASAAAGNSKTSPNNSLKGQTNIARNGKQNRITSDRFALFRTLYRSLCSSMSKQVTRTLALSTLQS